MGFEQVGYIYEYELGALAAFLVIMLRYFGARRFPNLKNRLYSVIMWATVADVIFDVLGSKTIECVSEIPLFYTYACNILYYLTTVMIMMLMMTYTLTLTGPVDRKRMRRMTPLFVPGVAVLLLIVTNPLTRLFFYIDPVQGYVREPMFGIGYIVCLMYMIATLVITLCNRKALRREEYFTIILFLIIALGATVIQFLLKTLLVTGVAMVVSVMLMYFTIQKPDSMVDTTTHAFTYDAMISFLKDRFYEHEAVQFMAIKINNMSRINELLGVENGNRLLRQVCRCLQDNNKDIWVFRMRGSCFVAVTRKKDDYRALCERLKNRINRAWTVGSTEVLLQATLCLAADDLLDAPIVPDDVLSFIDTAFLGGQRSGERITTVAAGGELVQKSKRRKAVELALRDALATDTSFELNFQPIWSVEKKRFVSAEVLLRFSHPSIGSVSPGEFVSIAENCGLVTDMDEMVVKKVCKFIEEYDVERIGIERLEINLSALEFMHRRLPDLLSSIMLRYSVNPAFLCFEITETAAIESFEVLKDCMSKIRELGCVFALDDFGTGYANISKVFHLPFELIKMDKSLLYDSEDFLGDLAKVFKRTNRKVLVEGVETEAQAEQCSSCDIDYIQGYYYARPMGADTFISFMQEQGKTDE